MTAQNHSHPLNAQEIWCSEHAYEIISIFNKSNREQDAIECLINFFKNADAQFILDKSDRAVKLRKHLWHQGIHYSVQLVQLNDIERAKSLLESIENILTNVKFDKESSSLLSTVCVNLSCIYWMQEEVDLAVDVLDRAFKIDKKNGDLVGWITVSLNQCTIMNQIGSHSEAYEYISEAIKLLEGKVDAVMSKKADVELWKNSKFMYRIHLLCACYHAKIETISNIGTDLRKLEEIRNHALRLATRFLGATHYLTTKIGAIQHTNPARIRRNPNIQHLLDIQDTQQSSTESRYLTDDEIGAMSQFETFDDVYEEPKNEGSSVIHKSPPDLNQIAAESPKQTSPKEEEKIIETSESKPKRLVYPSKPPKYSRPVDSSKQTKTEKQIKSENLSQLAEKRAQMQTIDIIQQDRSFDNTKKPLSFLSEFDQFAKALPTEQPLEIRKNYVQIRLPGQTLPPIPERSQINRNRFITSNMYQISVNDISFLLAEELTYIKFEDGMKISQIQCVQQEDYMITCSISRQNDGQYFIISAIQLSNPNIHIISETLLVQELNQIINLLKYRYVFPKNMQPQFVNNFRKFAQYFLFPFIRVSYAEESDSAQKQKKLELWESPNTIYQQEVETTLLGISVYLLIHFITTNTIRLVISQTSVEAEEEENNESSTLQIEFVFDNDAAAKYLQSQDNIAKDDSRQHTLLQSIRLLDDSFLEFIKQTLPKFEAFVHNELCLTSFDDVSACSNLIQTRVSIEGQDLRPTLWVVIDNPKAHSWNIWYLNCAADTFDRVSYNYPYERIVSNYGVNGKSLGSSHRETIWHYVLNQMQLDIDEDKAVIFENDIEIVAAHRVIVGDVFRTPLTLSLIKCADDLIGIRAGIFWPEQCVDQGILIILEGEFYKQQNAQLDEIQKKIEDKAYKSNLFTCNENQLIQALEDESVWEIILKHLKITVTEQKWDIQLVNRLQETVRIESLENIIAYYN